MKKIFFTFLLVLTVITASGQTRVNFHNEQSDTLRINEILASNQRKSGGELIESIARTFLGAPYVAGTLENNDTETLTINLDEFDCTTLVETVMALAITVNERRQSWRDFVYNLQRIRYRGGQPDSYASRLHYISDWIIDNTHRGNFREVTSTSDLATYEVKTIDFMSSNRELYPALADDALFNAIKNVEIGYRSHRYPIIKTGRIGKAMKGFLETGDIVAITTGKKGLDVSHMGIIVDVKGVKHLLHASSAAGKVSIDKLPLDRYLTRYRHTGIRVIRL